MSFQVCCVILTVILQRKIIEAVNVTMKSQPTGYDVFSDNSDVIVPVRPRLLVPETQSVKNFVDGYCFPPASGS